jgi:flagellar hook-associated protein 3 FlgL
MSLSLSTPLNATDFGTLNQAVAATGQIERTIAGLTAETASGYAASTFAGLGDNAGAALDLSPQIAANTALQSSTASAANIQAVAQTALGQIQSIAATFATQATTLITTPTAAPSIAATANDALLRVAGLLDTQVGGIYVFAGQDSTTPPVPNPNGVTQSAFYTAIQTAIGNLGTNGAASTSSATLAIAAPGGTSPFAPSLEAAGAQSEADLGNGTRVTLAPLANANSNALSAGTGNTSTGSYTRDLLLGLATLGSLTTASTTAAGFTGLVQNTITTLNGAAAAANTDIAALGDRQDQVTAAQSELTGVNTALQTQLSNVQDADLTQVATQLAQAQTQLQASYQVISALSQLSLTKYLPT